MAEFKKNSYDISLPNVSSAATLATETYVNNKNLQKVGSIFLESRIYESISLGSTAGGNETECEIFLTDSNLCGDVNGELLFSSSSSSSTGIKFIFTTARYNFLHLKLIRSSNTSTTWNYIAYYNLYDGGSTSMKTKWTSAPTYGNPLYPLGFSTGSIVLNSYKLFISLENSGTSSSGTMTLNYIKR